ncbi:FtsK/SpoIIIE family DNA translocase [Candidatus Puniceispirillum marinum]|uniref:DNA translocase FtsK n=1 Tax=Puniceispirillum marinum (strain IMCC1322) TaxID=488538 RepID=D5BMK8_PUNMI|nr:DNA translocase FtsK 4TM domain-containing protein [Candidatus Puniceispirillum marinum]ADE40051.1 DNA segregation ATPase FtsK/SpoIIIE [Candidatus Puniceispirillum marinum IMCC1322]
MQDETEKKPLLSTAVARFLQHRLMELVGLCLFGLGCLVMAALIMSYATDPGPNVSSTSNVRHQLGSIGANLADGLIASIGWASFALAAIPILWGIRLIRKRVITHFRVRFFMVPFSLILLTVALQGITPDGYAVAASQQPGKAIGGMIGSTLLHNAVKLAEPLPEFLGFGTAHYLGLAFGVFGVWSWLWSAALSRQQWLGLGRVTGRISAGIKSVFGAAGNLVARDESVEKPVKKAKPKRNKKTRQEPVLVAGASTDDAEAKTDGRVTKAGNGKQTVLDFDAATGFKLPPQKLLQAPGKSASAPAKAVLQEHANMLETVLSDFSVKGNIADVRYGPVVTRYDLNPAPGTKSQRVISLADDIARSMSAISVRVAVVPGQNVIGIELPNEDRQTVILRDVLDSAVWRENNNALPMALGKDIAGAPIVVDLAKMPHLLVAGTTGSGKSVGINAMILSLLYRHTPESCRMIMIDPKMLELSVYDGIPHLLSPVVTDPSKAVVALKWAVREMENRYRNMAKMGVRNITGYNDRLAEARAKGETLTRRVQTGFDPETGKPIHEEEILDLAPLPYIVVLIDEVADLMLVAGKEIEAAVQRLAQMARAAGIHVIMATQRPSVDVITGTIKANFPTRISFQVTSRIDSRTILGEQGAEQLLGRGDMLFMEGGGRVMRVHGPFVQDGEVEAVANFLRLQGEPEYDERVVADAEDDNGGGGGAMDGVLPTGNSLYEQAVQLVVREQKASTSFVQRHLKIGYNRAATIIEEMESNGIISAANHVGKRDVLITDEADNGF